MATVKARTAAHSLQRDFDCAAAAFDFDSNHVNHARSDANYNSSPAAPGPTHDHPAGGGGGNRGMDAMDLSAIPPPPRDDASSDSENDRRADHLHSQLHHDAEGGLGEPSANALDVTLDSTLFGTLSCCGEDTLHVLMDAELALASATAPGNMNLGASGNLRAGNLGAGDWRTAGAGGDESDGEGVGLAGDAGAGGPPSPRNDGRKAGGSALRPATGSTIHANHPPNPNSLPHDDDENDHLSTGAASLLRGPLMAAKSANLAGGAVRSGGETTPSKARDALLRSAMKAPRPPSGGASSMETVHLTPAAAATGGGAAEGSATPSAARNAFLRAAVTAARPPSDGETSGSAGYSADFHSWNGQSPGCGAGAGNVVGAVAGSAAGSVTPSAARNGFATSARKAPPRPGTSPSARSGPDYGGGISGGPPGIGNAGGQADGAQRNFGNDGDLPLRETQQHNNNNNSANDLGEAPSRPRAGLTISARKPRRRPPSLPLSANSPSAARNEFLTSPQDSVSTLGARSPTEEAALAARAAAGLGAACGGALLEGRQSQGARPGGAEQPHSQGRQQSAPRGAAAADRGMPPGATTPSTAAIDSRPRRVRLPPLPQPPRPPCRATAHAASHAGSLDGILARGERQIRDSVAAAEAVLRRTTSHSNDNPARPPTKQCKPRRPFLRKGARKEPSALHTLNAREGIAPSAQRRSTANTPNNAGGGTPNSAGNAEGSVAPSIAQRQSPAETPSDRQARLARLERMQEDLRDDLKRREARRAKAREARESKQREERERERAQPRAGVAPGTARAGVVPAAMDGARIRRAATNRARSASAGRMRAKIGAGAAETPPSPAPAAEAADEEGSLAEGHGGGGGLADVHVEGHTLPLDASEDVAPKPSSADNGNDDEAKRAEWKREEDEQRALIKNMRRRQEAALREAEGERERAKAWAAAEKASVQQWANEQRALIKKDRHKAANAALLATKKANQAKEMAKAAAGDEARRLRETIRRHERTIGTLRSATGSNAGGMQVQPGGAATAAAKAKSPNGGGAAPRRRALSDHSSRQNARPGGPTADAHRRKSSEGGLEATAKKPFEAAERPEAAEVVVGEEVVATEEVADADTLTEEPTDLWLHRRLAQLNAANNHLGDKGASGGPQLGEGVAPEPPAGQRRPPDRVDAVPQVVTAVSPSFQAAVGSDVHPPGQGAAPGKSQIFTYKNGTQKEVLPDGTTTISFANGDRKRTYAREKEGIVVYYYAATQTTQVTHQDGMQTYHFPNKQIENHYADGRKEITYPDGTTRMIYNDGTCDTTFVDGVRVVDLADGTQRVMQA
ncbi:hypothetical protein ACHAXT_007996 [Thalassiosira profunda]